MGQAPYADVFKVKIKFLMTIWIKAMLAKFIQTRLARPNFLPANPHIMKTVVLYLTLLYLPTLAGPDQGTRTLRRLGTTILCGCFQGTKLNLKQLLNRVEFN